MTTHVRTIRRFSVTASNTVEAIRFVVDDVTDHALPWEDRDFTTNEVVEDFEKPRGVVVEGGIARRVHRGVAVELAYPEREGDTFFFDVTTYATVREGSVG